MNLILLEKELGADDRLLELSIDVTIIMTIQHNIEKC
jgi:hypothetical protein